jgi:hypothetical protein
LPHNLTIKSIQLILPFSGLFAFSDYLGYFPGHKMIGCLTSACFLVPGMKHVFTWASASSVEKKNLQKLLSTGWCLDNIL